MSVYNALNTLTGTENHVPTALQVVLSLTSNAFDFYINRVYLYYIYLYIFYLNTQNIHFFILDILFTIYIK
jgi:hypothetical protein